MTPALPKDFFRQPFAHRGLHGEGRPENSLSAVRAAVEAGFGIEIDVQPSSDGQAMVFHDETLDRMTRAKGAVSDRAAEDLKKLKLKGASEGIPLLSEVLEAIAGRVPVVIEIKDQDGALGPRVGGLEAAVARDVDLYDGPIAVMSFNPHAMTVMRDLAPRTPRGLATSAFTEEDWPNVPEDRRLELSQMQQLEEVGAQFISHDARDLQSRAVARARAASCSILCWTIRTEDEAEEAMRIADQITFEGFLPT